MTKRLMFRIFIWAILCSSLYTPYTRAAELSSSRVQANKDILSGIELLYDGEFDQAERHFNTVIAEGPSDPLGYFYMAMVSWSRLTSGFWDKETVREFGDRIDVTISVAMKKIEEGEADSFSYFYLGGALGFKGRFELMRYKWLSSYNLAVQAIEALKSCQDMDSQNRDVLFGLGIFDYYTARLSGFLKFLTYLLLHRGDKEEGLRKMTIAANEAVYSAIEAKSMLVYIYIFLERDPRKALPLIRDLSHRFQNNPNYKHLEGVVYVLLGMKADYGQVIDHFYSRSLNVIPREKASIWSRRVLYLEACYLLFHEEFEQARGKLGEVLSSPDPERDPLMIAWPLLKTGMSYDAQGDRDRAISYYKQVQAMENAAGAQFLAERYLAKPAIKKDVFLGY